MKLTKDEEAVSKFMSYVLRHKPDAIGIKLTSDGWVSIDELLDKAKAHNEKITREQLDRVVEFNNKKRFEVLDGRIRASQGHSIDVDLKLKVSTPPGVLYHGTAERFVKQIMSEGIKSMDRHAVHLSADKETARSVGTRHGKPVILQVEAALMVADGIQFEISANGVWLTDHVAPKYISVVK